MSISSVVSHGTDRKLHSGDVLILDPNQPLRCVAVGDVMILYLERDQLFASLKTFTRTRRSSAIARTPLGGIAVTPVSTARTPAGGGGGVGGGGFGNNNNNNSFDDNDGASVSVGLARSAVPTPTEALVKETKHSRRKLAACRAAIEEVWAII